MFSREIKAASPKSRCSIVLGFQYSLSLDEVEVEDEMSTGSISGPDDKPGPVFGSGSRGDRGDVDGFLVFSVFEVVDFDVVCGCFLEEVFGGGDSARFGGALARRVVSS